jgi:hypothetical protein
MRFSRKLRLGATLALGATAAVVLAAAAGAGQVIRETIHEEGTDTIEDFCGVAGLTVESAFVLDSRVLIVPHGRDRLQYFHENGTLREVVTNLANGKSVSSVTKVLDKDLRVTDNGDGTLTILVLATGNSVLYGANGKAIARDPGQTRFELLIDHGGTPADPSDDEFLEFLGVVKDSTGRSDDFCAAAVRALS